MTSFAELLQLRYAAQLDDRAGLYIRNVSEGARRMKSLVQDILAFSRVRTQERSWAPVDLNVVVGDVLRSLGAAVEHSGGTVTHGPLPTVRGDRGQLTQLLQNLVGNALKFTRAGVDPEVRIQARLEGPNWHVEVQDNGIGIEPQYFEKVFAPFQRLHARTEYEGTGMGLAICQQIVERHVGHLWVESVPGEGTTFHFTLPDGKEG